LSVWQRFLITSEHREQWYLTLAKLARDGIALFVAIQSLERELRLTRHPLAPLLRCVLFGLRGGEMQSNMARSAGSYARMSTLRSRALGRADLNWQQGLGERATLANQLRGLVPEPEVMLIQAGDVSGQLALGLENAAKFIAARRALQGALQLALIKPLIYLLGLCALLLYFSWIIFPQLQATTPRANWSSGFLELAFVADHVVLFMLGLMFGVMSTGAVVFWVLPRFIHPSRFWLDRHVFPFSVYANLNGAYFLMALSGFIEAGLPFSNAVQSIRTFANPYLAHQCELLLMSLKGGQQPARALTQLSIIDRSDHWLIMVYAMSSDASKAYGLMAERMRAKVARVLKWVLGDVLGGLMLALVGASVYWIYAQLMGGVSVVPLG
jgi:type II secretory pathway component PulF